jgi:hypothetical protein
VYMAVFNSKHAPVNPSTRLPGKYRELPHLIFPHGYFPMKLLGNAKFSHY